MRWTFLGHASWLAEAGGVRVVMDPVLSETYHDGVFEVYPPRDVDVAGLAADVVVVTHAHPDHFDPRTLKALVGRADRLITADPLVEHTARALGYRTVERVGPDAVVSLGGATWTTTRSWCDVEEWGLIAATDAGTVWNQVDSAVRDPVVVRGMLASAAERLGRPGLARGPDVALVRWCPLLQAEGPCSGRIGFPVEAYASELRNAAATGARTVMPGSCGDRFVGGSAWQNASIFPVTEGRFVRDLQGLLPGVDIRRPRIGVPYTLRDGRFDEGAPVPWVRLRPAPDDRVFAPFELPPIRDPAPPGFDADAALVILATWVVDALAPGLGAWCARHRLPPLSLVLEIVLPARTVGFTLRPEGGRCEVEVGTDPEHDGLDRVAGSVLLDVIEGRSPWGRALLGGWMRSVRRAYRVEPGGVLTVLGLPAFLGYVALPYETSVRRWVAGELHGMGVPPSACFHGDPHWQPTVNVRRAVPEAG